MSSSVRSGSGLKSLLHRQLALSAALFIAQAETAELTAVMSLALMECFVCVCARACARVCARATWVPCGAARQKRSSMQEPRWPTVGLERREGMWPSPWSEWSAPLHGGVQPPASACRCAGRRRRFHSGEADGGVMTSCG